MRLGSRWEPGPTPALLGAARALDPDIDDESHLPGTREGQLTDLFEAAGLREIEATALSVSLEHPKLRCLAGPSTRGVGPAGDYLASLDPVRRTELREGCRRQVPSEPFVVDAVAWAARALA